MTGALSGFAALTIKGLQVLCFLTSLLVVIIWAVECLLVGFPYLTEPSHTNLDNFTSILILTTAAIFIVVPTTALGLWLRETARRAMYE